MNTVPNTITTVPIVPVIAFFGVLISSGIIFLIWNLNKIEKENTELNKEVSDLKKEVVKLVTKDEFETKQSKLLTIDKFTDQNTILTNLVKDNFDKIVILLKPVEKIDQMAIDIATIKGKEEGRKEALTYSK